MMVRTGVLGGADRAGAAKEQFSVNGVDHVQNHRAAVSNRVSKAMNVTVNV
jgi:hypothetical protein